MYQAPSINATAFPYGSITDATFIPPPTSVASFDVPYFYLLLMGLAKTYPQDAVHKVCDAAMFASRPSQKRYKVNPATNCPAESYRFK